MKTKKITGKTKLSEVLEENLSSGELKSGGK